MNKPKVELKNVKFHEGREGQGVNADVFINGVKVYHVRDDGNGGCLDFDLHSFDIKTRAIAKELTDYIDSIPEKPLDFGNGVIKDEQGNVRMEKTTLEDYVNELLYAYQRDKDTLKFEKKKMLLYKTAIVFGDPATPDKYSFLNMKKPLNQFPLAWLQQQVDNAKAKYVNGNVQFLNKNHIESLGINL